MVNDVESKRRELFEKWWEAGANAQYYKPDAWDIWNDALDSIEIVLPQKYEGDHGGCIHEAGIYDGAIDECREAIIRSGVGLRMTEQE